MVRLPKRLERATIYESEWVNLYVDRVQLSSGKIVEKYHQLEYPKQSVVVVVTNDMGEICFTENLRYSMNAALLEVPAGWMEHGETPVETAAREVLEETGYKTAELRHVYSYNPSVGMARHTVNVVFGKVIENGQAQFDSDEVAKVIWLSKAEIGKLVSDNKILDGITLFAVLLHEKRSFGKNH